MSAAQNSERGSLARSSRSSQREHNIMQVTAAPLRLGLDGLRREPLPRKVSTVWQHEACHLRHGPCVDWNGVSQQRVLLGWHGRACQDLVVRCGSRSRHSRSLRREPKVGNIKNKLEAWIVCILFPVGLLTGANITPLKSWPFTMAVMRYPESKVPSMVP
jgi:hypothetical protein